MNILLIRHGETELNAARILQPVVTPLSARGRRQSELLAARVATLGIAAVLTSDLARARQTADAIAAATGAPLSLSETLRERDFGDWRGLPLERLATNALTAREAPPGGESADAFEARAARAFAEILATAATLSGPLAVVSHGLMIGALLARHVRLPAEIAIPTHLGNTALSVFDARPPHLASLVNCTRHLDAAQADDPSALSGG